MTLNKLLCALLFTALFSMGAIVKPAFADDITYVVDVTLGTGSVIGAITTDGTFGVLAESDIVGGSLRVSGFGRSYVASLPGDIYNFEGDDLTANLDSLIFNFSGGDDGGLVFTAGTPADYLS